jgi:hypothetical protein
MRDARIGVLIKRGHQIIEHHGAGFLIDIGIDSSVVETLTAALPS